MKSSLCLLLVGTAPSGTWGSSIRGVQPVQVKPPLDPTSDRVFRKDYVHDLDPKGQAKIKFHHPYPMVQDTSDYDTDYPKDENNDDGEWKAQMEYDLLRTKVAKEKDDYERAKAAEAATAKELEEARKAEEAAEKAAKEAEERAKQAQEDAKNKKATADEKAKAKADADAASAAGGSKGNGISDAAEDSEDADVKAAVDKVKKEMEDLENCQKELAEARKKLKELMEKKKEDGEKHHKEEETKLKNEAEKRTAESEKASADSNSANAKALAEEAELAKKRAEEASRKRKLAEEEAMHVKAEEAFHEEERDMEALEKDIGKAADRLRKFRKDVDSSGGVYRTQEEAPPVKSNASTRSVGLALVAVILAMFLQ